MSHDTRLNLLHDWLSSSLGMTDFSIEPASADASFRRYFRVFADNKTWVAMDAPPDKEDCEPFVRVAQLIEACGAQAPHIYQQDKTNGFMLLSDLGSTPYLNQLDEDSADGLYQQAIDALILMQSIQNGLPDYDAQLLNNEMALFKDWYIGQHLNVSLSNEQSTMLQTIFDYLAQSALKQKKVFVHRDYHSRNLMITADKNPGIIDFQDAVNGPISYDLVSLLKDCYIAWPRKKLLTWLNYYVENNPLLDQSLDDFIKAFELMGLQRHLKAIGIFARLNHRDGKPNYLDDIPRTLAYVYDVSARYEELAPLLKLLQSLNIQADPDTLELIQ
jgi:aminoglycoside/choline kinase family phosphotransferase